MPSFPEHLLTHDGIVQAQIRDGHTALITLNRPAARNAINAEVANQIEALVDATEQDPQIRAVVLASSHPDVFSAGADLKEVSAGRGDTLSTERGGFAGLVFSKREKPWIAAVNGKALAGGCELALACDMVVASAKAAFGLPEVLRGLIAAAGGLYRLPRILPPNIALEVIATAIPIDAERAYRLGLVNRLVEPDEVIEQALVLANQIAANAPIAVRESLRVARAAFQMSEAEMRELTRDARAIVVASNDFKEGPLAFIEKRAPNWTGT